MTMKNIYFLLFLFISLQLSAQYIPYDPDRGMFDNDRRDNRFVSNRRPYEELRRRSEENINRDVNNAKSIINNSASIYGEIRKEELSNKTSGSPGAPGEPVPINNYIVQSFLLALALIIMFCGKIRMYNQNRCR